MDPTVFETKDVFGDSAALFKSQWNGHIKPGHPEVEPFADQIRLTIESPECVYSSSIRTDVKAFYRRHEDATRFSALFLKVIVEYDEEPARILTLTSART